MSHNVNPFNIVLLQVERGVCREQSERTSLPHLALQESKLLMEMILYSAEEN